jgi:transcriptional regulator with XRE-family HTH domain
MTERVALAVPEQRLELGLSLNQLARYSGVSRSTIARIERGQRVSPVLLLRVAGALTTLELYRTRELEVAFPETRVLDETLQLLAEGTAS